MWDEGTKASGLVLSCHVLAWADLTCVLRGIGTLAFHHSVSDEGFGKGGMYPLPEN